jgi:hypothetical protein
MGVNNLMTYVTGDIPVGNYNSMSLANLGLGHGAIDAGGGYTYFNPATGQEFSAVAGLTYNFKNTTAQYQSGVDFHLDWGASQFLSKQVFIGLVGYAYDQVSADSGSGDRVGAFESRVFSAGAQLGYIFPIAGKQRFLGSKSYFEFGAKDRPEGWNTWLTFAISDAPPTQRGATGPRAQVRVRRFLVHGVGCCRQLPLSLSTASFQNAQLLLSYNLLQIAALGLSFSAHLSQGSLLDRPISGNKVNSLIHFENNVINLYTLGFQLGVGCSFDPGIGSRTRLGLR